MRINRILILFGVLALFAGCRKEMSEPESRHDFSNRVSLIETRTIGSFEDEGLDGFKAGEGVSIRLDNGGFFGLRPHRGNGVLLVSPEAEAPAWRGVRKDFPTPEDFSATPL